MREQTTKQLTKLFAALAAIVLAASLAFFGTVPAFAAETEATPAAENFETIDLASTDVASSLSSHASVAAGSEVIEDDATPMASGVATSFSTINLAAALATIALCIIMLFSSKASRMKTGGHSDATLSFLGILPALMAIAGLVLTQNFGNPPAPVLDTYSTMFIAGLAVQAVLTVAAFIVGSRDIALGRFAKSSL